MSPYPLSNKIDDTISLDNLQKLKLAFEVLYKEHRRRISSIYDSLLEDLTVFFFVKEFEMGSLRSIDVKNFGRILKKCLGLPKTVRQCGISLYILLSLRFFSCLCLSLSLFFALMDKPLQLPD